MGVSAKLNRQQRAQAARTGRPAAQTAGPGLMLPGPFRCRCLAAVRDQLVTGRDDQQPLARPEPGQRLRDVLLVWTVDG